MQDFKKLQVWEKAHSLVLSVYRISQPFPKAEQFGMTSQLRRAAYSIAANIAEGCGKQSNLEFARYLHISLGSANETEYFLLLAHGLEYLKKEEYENLNFQINEIKAMLISLINKVKK
jgi:four helix bundle protein